MYKRQYKKLFASGQYDMQKLEYVINLLAQGKELPSKYKNHHLKGDLKNFMECHIESDWLLMYYIQKERLILLLVRTGSHNEVLQ